MIYHRKYSLSETHTRYYLKLVFLFWILFSITSCGNQPEVQISDHNIDSHCTPTFGAPSTCFTKQLSSPLLGVTVPVVTLPEDELRIVEGNSGIVLEAIKNVVVGKIDGGENLSITVLKRDPKISPEQVLRNIFIKSLPVPAQKYCAVEKIETIPVLGNTRERYEIHTTRDINEGIEPFGTTSWTPDSICGEYSKVLGQWKYFEFEEGKEHYFFVNHGADGDMFMDFDLIKIHS